MENRIYTRVAAGEKGIYNIYLQKHMISSIWSECSIVGLADLVGLVDTCKSSR